MPGGLLVSCCTGNVFRCLLHVQGVLQYWLEQRGGYAQEADVGAADLEGAGSLQEEIQLPDDATSTELVRPAFSKFELGSLVAAEKKLALPRSANDGPKGHPWLQLRS